MEASLVRTKDSKYTVVISAPLLSRYHNLLFSIHISFNQLLRKVKKNTLDDCFLYSNVLSEISECQCIGNLDAGIPGNRIKFYTLNKHRVHLISRTENIYSFKH